MIKGEEVTQTGWTEKEQAIEEDFIWGVEAEALYQITRAEYKMELGSKIKYLIQLFTEFYSRRETLTIIEEISSEEETPEEFRRQLFEIEKECIFNTISADEVLISKYITSIAMKKIRDTIMKERHWN